MGRPKGSKNKVAWNPEPKIDVEAPKKELEECSQMTDPYTMCGHEKRMHYGGQKGHCNMSGCTCQEFK